MNKKMIYGLIAVVFIFLLFVGMSFVSESQEGQNDFDTSFYVEDNGNLFIKLAKLTDRFCYFVIDIIVSSISMVFRSAPTISRS